MREEDNQILAESGWTGLLARITAGGTDPLLLVPATGTLKAGTKVFRGAMGALTGAGIGAGVVAAQESVLVGTQVGRERSEIVTGAVAGALVGGVLGGAIGLIAKPTTTSMKDAAKVAMQEKAPSIKTNPDRDWETDS